MLVNLCESLSWSRLPELNRRPSNYESDALPTELSRPISRATHCARGRIALYESAVSSVKQSATYVTSKEKTRLLQHRRKGRSLAKFVVALVFLIGCAAQEVHAQKKSSAGSQKLPSAEKIVDKYLKAIGGRRRVATIHDTTLGYSIQLDNKRIGRATIQSKVPGSLRSEMVLGIGAIITSSSSSSVWAQGVNGEQRTLTGAEANAVKLQALLDASHLLDYKKLNVAARVVAMSDQGSEPVFVVEFSMRSGARINYYFSRNSGLITKIEDESRRQSTWFSDYGVLNGLLQPRTIRFDLQGIGPVTLSLEHAEYNTSLTASVFDPSDAGGQLNVVALLRAVARNQDQLEQRFTEYSFLQKETDREINGKGEVTKETVKVHEVFPIAHRESILKLISENGVTLTGERAAKEEKRVQDEFVKAERDAPKNEQKEQKR